MLKGATMKKRMKQNKNPAGMCPNMTVPPKRKPRKKPNPYKAPLSVRKYYDGISYGIDLLRDELLELLTDDVLVKMEVNTTHESLEETIKYKANRLKAVSNKKLTDMEKAKTKQKIKEWEEKEWESI